MNKQTQFIQACREDDLETVKALINHPDVDPSVLDNSAMRWASSNGHKEVVELLMQDSRVDPSDVDNVPIRIAAYRGYKDVVELLLTDERVMDKIDVAFEWCKEWDGYVLLKASVGEHKRQEKERRVQEAIEEMSADCELYF